MCSTIALIPLTDNKLLLGVMCVYRKRFDTFCDAFAVKFVSRATNEFRVPNYPGAQLQLVERLNAWCVDNLFWGYTHSDGVRTTIVTMA